jgi:hypothetical protein
MPNVELLRQTLAHIEANPDEWDQRDWRRETSCGTAYCFAGWAVKLTGGEFCRDSGGKVFGSLVKASGSDVPLMIADYAAELLGLPPEVDEYGGPANALLFYSRNTLDDLRRIVAELCEDES